MRDEAVTVALVRRARAGDQGAWDEIVERFAPLVWAICKRHRLSAADADDVGQSLWLGLLEHFDSLREPAALPGWIATTTRRECLKVHNDVRRRRSPVDSAAADDEVLGADPTAVPVDEGLLVEERRAAVRAGYAALQPHCRRLLALMVSDPPLSYAQIAEILDVPVGGLGPTRARCLEKLRRSVPLAAFLDRDSVGRGSSARESR
jgi:RNA polymerase sigma factor (sigma-70 family)